MLNQLLSGEQSLFVIDTETTSLDTQTARIVEIAFQQWKETGMVKEWSSRINPGIPIPAETTRIHGITDADVAGRPTFKQLAPNLAKGFSNCSFCGKNCRYDLRILAAEFARAGVAWSYLGAYIIDADRLEQLGEPRHLTNLYKKHTGKDLIDAHSALADVQATSEVIVAQLEKYEKVLPRDLKRLHEMSWPGFIDAEGKFKIIDGVACVAFGKWNGKPMKSVDPSYWDWLLGADFPADVKQLARDAKLGKYPEGT